jgi:ferredoxin-NADP reductase
MKKHIVKIQSIEKITHNVLRIVTERPAEYSFTSGQATDISINKKSLEDKKNPYTFTSLPEDEFLEFTMKIYPSHHGLTNEIQDLKAQDELILHDVFGAITYKGEGTFIAGGAGVTPFISILRHLESIDKIGNNTLLFANTTENDIILKDEFTKLLGNNFINILSEDTVEGYANGRITKDFIEENNGGIDKLFYLCGPPPMMEAVEKQLKELQVDEKSIIKEAFN